MHFWAYSNPKMAILGAAIAVCLAVPGAVYAQALMAGDTVFKVFNPDHLKFDKRMGIIHDGGQYPDRTHEGDFLVYGTKAAVDLGFQMLEVFLDPRVCRAANGKTVKYSLYQTDKYCDPANPRKMLAIDLKTLASSSDYVAVFSNPAITRYAITFDPLNPKAANQSLISKLDRDWTPNELNLLYEEVRQLTMYFLTTYNNSGKEFILSAPSEMDWHLTGVGHARGGCNHGETTCMTLNADPQAVRNTILYLNRIQDAITDAEKELGGYTNVNVTQACEINFVVRVDPALKTGLTEVIPHTRCDYVAWSAHEAFREIQAQFDRNAVILKNGNASTDKGFVAHPEDLIRKGLDRISQFPPENKPVGYKDIFIGEIGFKENYDSLDAFMATIKAALQWGVYSVDLWELFDNSCKVFSPTAAQAEDQKACKGFWLLKPGTDQNSLVPSPLLKALYAELAVPGP